jgi:predicted RNA-binding Zn-ribbon protein involved in translation (DUF1610 family)
MPKNSGAESGRQKSLLYAALTVLIVAVALGYMQLRSGKAQNTAFTGPSTTIRKCTNCGAVIESPADELRKKGYLDLEGGALFGEGKICPKCHKSTLALAAKCPKDGTVFLPSQGNGRCPKCGWNPLTGR